MPTPSRTTPGLDAYLPLDRRRALARGQDLPERSTGTALFSDLSGFTPLMEHLSQTLGPQRGAEELTRLLNALFTPMIAEVHRCGGAIIAFGGDALTCWFPSPTPLPTPLTPLPSPQSGEGKGAGGERRGSPLQSAARCALALQRHVAAFGPMETPAGPVRFAIKVGLASGEVRRFCVGRSPYGLCDVLAGATMDRMAEAQHRAANGQVVVDATTAAGLPGAALQPPADGFAVLTALPGAAPRPAGAPLAVEEAAGDRGPGQRTAGAAEVTPLPLHQVRRWLAQPLYRRLRAGRGALAADLRLVTPMFVSFGGIDYDHDPEAGHKLQAYVVLAQEHLAPYEGHLALVSCDDKGSLLYILFGAPIAHEDDPVRALDFALAFQEAVQALPFIQGQRIGISQGRAYAGVLGSVERCTYSVLGDAVNTSARLMQAAPPGQVLVSQSVQKAVGGHYAFRSLGTIALKGKEEPLPIFTPLAADASWLAVEEEPLVGRAAEQQAIAGVLDRAQAGQGQVLFLLGEAGVGKSALVRHLLHRAGERGWNTRLSACLSYGQSTPYLPWRALLEEMARLTPALAPAERLARLRELVDALADPPGRQNYWRARFPLLGEVMGLEVDQTPLTHSLEGELRRDNTFHLLEAVVWSLAAGRPALVIVEDAHWADELSLQLAAHIGRGLADLPLLLVVVQRPPVEALPPALRSLQALPGTTTLVLKALESPAALELARQRLYAAALPPELESLLAERAQGNPFFIEELVRALLEAGCLRREGEAVQLHGDWGALQLPDTIAGLVQARLDRLPEEDRLTLKVSSTIGRAFERALVREVHPTRPAEPTLARQYERLVETAFVALEEAAPAWRYAFGHAILHEVTYGTLLFAQRRALHGAIGEVLERWHAGDLPRVLDLLAYHYARSEERAKAVHYLQRAGDKARREYANEVALGYYSQALERLRPEERELRYDLLAGRERVRDLRGEREEQARDLEELGRLAEGLGDAGRQVEVLNRQARQAVSVGEFERGMHFCRESLALAGAAQQHLGGAEAQRALGILHANLGQYHEAGEAFLRALESYQAIAHHDGTISALNNLGLLNQYQGNLEQALGFYHRGLEMAQEPTSRRWAAFILDNMSLAFRLQGEYGQARAHSEQALAIFREIGDLQGLEIALGNTGLLAMLQGDLETAQDCYGQALELARRLSDPEGVATSLTNLGMLAAYHGDMAQAGRYLVEARRQYLAIGQRRGEAFALHNWGVVQMWAGHPAAAQASFQEALALRQEAGETGNVLVTRAWLSLACLARGEQDRASACLDEVLAQLQAEGYGGDDPEQVVWWAAWQVLGAQGQTAEAHQALARAYQLVTEQAGRIGDPARQRSFRERIPVNRAIVAAWEDK